MHSASTAKDAKQIRFQVKHGLNWIGTVPRCTPPVAYQHGFTVVGLSAMGLTRAKHKIMMN